MDIKVRTIEEFRVDRVALELTVDQPELWHIMKRLFGETPDEAARVLDQAERAGKVPALEQQVIELKEQLAAYRAAHHCTDRCTEKDHVAFTGKRYVNDLLELRDKAEQVVQECRDEIALLNQERIIQTNMVKQRDAVIDDLKKQVQLYDVDRHTERDRADKERTEREKNEEWAERAENQVAAKAAQICELEAKLAREHEQHVEAVNQRATEMRRANDAEEKLAMAQHAREIETRRADGYGKKLIEIRGRVFRSGVDDYLEDHIDLAKVITDVRDIVNS